jgi:predicted RecA/RadA family phage recombinase
MTETMGPRGLPDLTGGYKTLDLTQMLGVDVPSDFEIEGVFGDIVAVTPIDENEYGEIKRDGIWLKQDVTKRMWRQGKVVKIGPQVKELKEGDIIAYPSDRGVNMIQGKDKKKMVFLNMERIFCKLVKKENV